MVGQAVEERAGEAFFAECGGPFVERQVRGDDGAPSPSLLLRSAMGEARTMFDPAGNKKTLQRE